MEQHELDHGDICEVRSGKFSGKTVLVIKAGINTKFGLKAITVEYNGEGTPANAEKIWVSPEQLAFIGERDTEVAGVIKEADYADWKARKDAGVPPKSSFTPKKPWMNKRKESAQEADDNFPD